MNTHECIPSECPKCQHLIDDSVSEICMPTQKKSFSPIDMEILDLYKKKHPELFARLPLPKDIAEKYGVPISDEVVPLKRYLSKFYSVAYSDVNAYEEKVACTITKSETSSEGQQERPQLSEDSKEATDSKSPESTPPTSSSSHPFQSDGKCITLSV